MRDYRWEIEEIDRGTLVVSLFLFDNLLLVTVGVQTSLRAPRLIMWALKTTIRIISSGPKETRTNDLWKGAPRPNLYLPVELAVKVSF